MELILLDGMLSGIIKLEDDSSEGAGSLAFLLEVFGMTGLTVFLTSSIVDSRSSF